MITFPVIITFDKTVGDIKGRIEILVSTDEKLLLILQQACTKVGIGYSDKFQVINKMGNSLDLNHTIEYHEITKGTLLTVNRLDKEKCNQEYYKYHTATTNRLWRPLAIVGIIFSILGLIILITIYIINSLNLYSYCVIIDAGSTSSKVYLYSWPSSNFLYNADVTQVDTCKTDQGISDYENNPSSSFTQIKSCLDKDILPKIPSDKKSITYLFLGATAGMRMLSYKNPNATDKILNFLRKSLSTYGLKVNNTMRDISIISGSIEGLAGWITVNYLLNNFPKTGAMPTSVIGAMDMGGASTQMTFVDSTPANSSDLFSLKLYGRFYTVYSHSYLCYGKSQAELRFLAVLLHMNNFSRSSNNPCMFLNEKAVFPAEELFFMPCVYGKFAVEEYGYEIIPPQDVIKDNVNFTFIGTSDYSECHALVQTLFNTSKCQNGTTCTFNGVYQPDLSGGFGAFSAYPMIKEKLNPKNDEINLTIYKQRLKLMCQNGTKIYTVEEDLYAKWLCFDLTFLIEMMVKLRFNDTNWKDIDFVNKIKDSNVGWSLGYMIDKTALIPREVHFLPLQNYLFGILLVVLSLILAFGLVFFFLSVKARRNKEKTAMVQCDVNEEQNLLSSTSSRD